MQVQGCSGLTEYWLGVKPCLSASPTNSIPSLAKASIVPDTASFTPDCRPAIPSYKGVGLGFRLSDQIKEQGTGKLFYVGMSLKSCI
ncbi:hypothetical protein [Microcoleus sp. M2_C6]|uniref:hypothetical protein n=1 Tax=unclassified Microcoleus TaxID=2642155 RepID=UPI002FCF9710